MSAPWKNNALRVFTLMLCVCTILGVVAPAISTAAPKSKVLFAPKLSGPDRLVTNEFAHWNKGMRGIRSNSDWWMTSGSFFIKENTGWTGKPDARAPDMRSQRSTNSSIFRLFTKRSNFKDVAVSLDVRTDRLISTSITPRQAWDGFHLLLRRQHNNAAYYVTIHRRDGVAIIKKKTAKQRYCTLTGREIRGANPIRFKHWQKARTTIKDQKNGSVLIRLTVDGKLVASARDDGKHCGPAIKRAGSIAIRTDNANSRFRRLVVRSH